MTVAAPRRGLPAQVELEITEAVLIRDDEAALAMLHQLRNLGVRIALDDFGTGYSSLSYLQRFPFDKIKIDRSFIKDIGDPDGSSSIVQAVVGIADARYDDGRGCRNGGAAELPPSSAAPRCRAIRSARDARRRGEAAVALAPRQSHVGCSKPAA